MPKFAAAPKGVKPEFTVNVERQLTWRYDSGGKKIYTWAKYNGQMERLTDMDPYHIIQILRTMACQGMKYCRAWYLFDQELRRRGVGMTGRITRITGGKPTVIYHGPGYATWQ